MRVCPAGSPVKAHAPALSRFPTSGFGRRSREVHRGGTGSKPNSRPARGAALHDSIDTERQRTRVYAMLCVCRHIIEVELI